MNNFEGTWIVRGHGGNCGGGVSAMVSSYDRLAYWTSEFIDAGAVISYELVEG